MRPPKDRDFVETVEGFFFCLIGYLHPPDRYTAYLKYTPSQVGRWARGDVFYHRELPYYHVRNVVRTLEFLAREHPQYVWLDPLRHLRFSFVPRDAVSAYYLPEARLAEIVLRPRDPLEEDVAALVELLTRSSGVVPTDFGITGSILLGLHNPTFSDIDLLVYGRENALRVKRAIEGLRGSALSDVGPERRDRWRAETAQRFTLRPKDVNHLETRRWNYFLFRNRYVSVHPTRVDGEIREVYGAHRYQELGVATLEATIADTTEALFLPGTYGLTHTAFQEGGPFPITELVCYEGLFCDFGDLGDRVMARGAVEARDGIACRLIVGTAALPDGGALTLVGPARPPGSE